jgi:hypothetical protein
MYILEHLLLLWVESYVRIVGGRLFGIALPKAADGNLWLAVREL